MIKRLEAIHRNVFSDGLHLVARTLYFRRLLSKESGLSVMIGSQSDNLLS